jgi:hypothetical protein
MGAYSAAAAVGAGAAASGSSTAAVSSPSVLGSITPASATGRGASSSIPWAVNSAQGKARGLLLGLVEIVAGDAAGFNRVVERLDEFFEAILAVVAGPGEDAVQRVEFGDEIGNGANVFDGLHGV